MHNDPHPKSSTTQRLCSKSELPEEGCKEFTVAGQLIFVISHNGRHVAYVNECPHLGIALNWAPDKFLDSDGKYIQCSMHGALFKPEDGECIHGPCLGHYLREVTLKQEGDTIIAQLS